MTRHLKTFAKRYLPGLLSLTILLVLAFFVPWRDVWDHLSDINPLVFIVLVLLGLGFYTGKAIRFWWILRLLGIKKRFREILPIYLAGQPVALLPAGEMYRAAMVHRIYDITLERASPSVTVQYIYEGVAVVSIGLIAALSAHISRLPVIAIAVVLGLLIYGFKTERLNRPIRHLPFINPSRQKVNKFVRDHEKLLGRKAFAQLLVLSYIPEIMGIATVYIAAHSTGINLTLINTCVVYTVPMILAAVALLPGGFGISEGGTFGLLRLFHATSGAAATVTLLYRVFNLGIGLAMGVVASFFVPRTSAK